MGNGERGVRNVERGAWLRYSHHAGWVALAVSALVASSAAAVDESDLVRRQADQRQARAMARELVSTVLDLQLRQLEENGLTDLPVYEDIRAMRGNLAGLVESEMAAVVERLVSAQRMSGAEREAEFVEARRAIRDVVIRLSVERQNLLRRLKAAEIAEQARRVLELQTTARDATVALPSVAEGRRAEAAVRTIEDQRDVKELFLRLTETLAELKTWDGEIATAASEGLRALTEAGVERRLDEVGRSLASAAFQDAIGHQGAVIEELRKLLAVVESAQGAVDDRREELADAIRRLREEQQTLRSQVEREGLTQPAKPETVETQQAIAEALGAFKEELAEDVTAAPLRDQAEAAAKGATEALFTADEARTLAEQQRAIDRLAALEEALREGGVEERQTPLVAVHHKAGPSTEITDAALADSVRFGAGTLSFPLSYCDLCIRAGIVGHSTAHPCAPPHPHYRPFVHRDAASWGRRPNRQISCLTCLPGGPLAPGLHSVPLFTRAPLP